jgi:PAS domain S-box-containing protein
MRRRYLAFALAACLLANGGALWLILASDHEPDKAATAALALTAALSFILAGLVAIWRRPHNRTGLLMSAVGFTWILGALTESNHAWVFTLALPFSNVAFAFLAHLLLAYPSGRLERRLDRIVVGVVWIVLLGGGFAHVLLHPDPANCAECPENRLFLWSPGPELVELVFLLLGVVLIALVLFLLFGRWRTATPAVQRVMAPVFLTATTALGLLFVGNIVDAFSADAADPFWWMFLAAFAVIPISFLVGVLRVRLARSAVADMLLALERGVPLREALARALGDPTLDLAYWIPSQQRFVHPDGMEFRADLGKRPVRWVERHGQRVGAIVHDPALNADVIDAIAAAAGLWLDHERLQTETRAELQFLETVVDTAPTPLCSIDTSGRITHFNVACGEVSGYDEPEQIRGMFFWDVLVSPEEKPLVQERFHAEAPVHPPAHLENAFVNRRGEERVIAWSTAPVHDELGAVRYIICGGLDVTLRQRRELQLQSSEELLRATVESSPVAIVEVDGSGRVTRWNPAAEEMFGWTAAEAIGRPPPNVPAEMRDEFRGLVRDTAAGRALSGHETYRVRKDGSRVDVELSAAPIRDSSGDVVSQMAIYVDVTERKRRAQELLVERDFATTVAQTAPVLLAVVDGDATIAPNGVNRAFERALGWRSEESGGRSFLELIDEDEEFHTRIAIGSAANGVPSGERESRWRCADGSHRTVSWSAHPIRSMTGAPLVLVSGNDVTERKLREVEAGRERDFLRKVADATPSLLVVVDESGTVVGNSVNRSFERTIGWTEEEMLGRSFLDLFRPEDRQLAQLCVAAALQGVEEPEQQSRWSTRDGRERIMAWTTTPFVDVDGRELVLICGVDVTERELREADLRSSEERLRAAIDASPVAIVEYALDDTITRWNPAAERIFGWAKEQVIGGKAKHQPPEREAELAELFGRVRSGEIYTGVETRRVRSDGAYIDVEVSAAPIRDAGGGVVSHMALFADITDRKRQEEEVRASRARIVAAGDEERRRLERNLHDGAQQRLVSLSLSLRLIEGRLRDDPDGAEALLLASREELGQALDELRELARGIHPAVLTDLGLSTALTGLASRSPVPVDVETPEERLPPPIEAAAYYVVAESLTNVAKYAQATSVAVSVQRQNGSAVVEVVDDGIGGADAGGGSGLRGLADRVEALDGTFQVESSPGGGTRIRAVMPLMAEGPPGPVAHG